MHTFSPNTKTKSSQVNENFADLASGAGDDTGNSLYVWRSEAMPNFVVSGLVWSISSGLIGIMTAGVAIIDGIRVTGATILSKTFTASKDTYVDIDTDGTIHYTEVANNATTGMTLASGRKRLCVVITNGSAITLIRSLGYDPLGNRYYNTVTYNPIVRHYIAGWQFADAADTAPIYVFIKRPKDALTINGRTVLFQPSLRSSVTGDYSMYRLAFNLKYGTNYVQIENSGLSVGDTVSSQTLTLTAQYVSEAYWCNYDMSTFDHRDVLRIDLHRDGAAGADTGTGIVELDGLEVYYNRDYGVA
jgi:hypothetical protein